MSVYNKHLLFNMDGTNIKTGWWLLCRNM